MMNKKEDVRIPDEFVPNYSLPTEEQKKQWDEHTKGCTQALEKLFGQEENNN